MNKSFGVLIRELRTKRGVSLRKFAADTELSPTFISGMERGNFSPPSEPKIIKIAEVLGQDADELLALTGRIPSDVVEIILQKPKEMTSLIRRLNHASAAKRRNLALVYDEEKSPPLEFFPLDSISLETHTAIIGPSNSGKSLLIRHLIHTYFKEADIKVYDSDARPGEWKELTVMGRKANYTETALEMAEDIQELQRRTELYGDGLDPGNEIVRVVEEWPTTAASLTELALEDVSKEIATNWLKLMLRRGRKYRMKIFCVAQEFEVNAWKIGGEGGLRNAFTVLYLGKSARTALRKVSDKDLKAQLKKHFDNVKYPCLADVQGQFYPVEIPNLAATPKSRAKS